MILISLLAVHIPSASMGQVAFAIIVVKHITNNVGIIFFIIISYVGFYLT
jgi:hypothetical protein